MALPESLYDLLLTEGLLERVDLDRSTIEILTDGAAELLTDALGRQLTDVLEDPGGNAAEKLPRQLDAVNALLVLLRQRVQTERGDRELAQIVDADCITGQNAGANAMTALVLSHPNLPNSTHSKRSGMGSEADRKNAGQNSKLR